MALWVCAGCTTAYAVGSPCCPHCRSTDHYEEGTMPKITVHGGPSNDAEPPRYEWVGEAGPELFNLPAGETTEEEPSPGNSSETSPEKPQPSDKPSSSKGRSRARTTASRSAQAPTAGSSAPSTDGSPTADDGGPA